MAALKIQTGTDQASTDRSPDLTMLSRAVEYLLRYLARMLVGKFTLVAISNLLREVFVQEAEARLRSERPGKNVPLSQLALLTGLDTRTLIRVRGELAARQTAREKQARLADLSSEAKVVEAWALNPRFRDPHSGQPRSLEFNRPGCEFELLVREVVTARGVTVQSILERLLATGSVTADWDNGRLSLLTERYSPFNTEDEMSLMANGMQSLINLAGTISRNVHATQDQRLLQRELWTFRLDRARREEFRARVREFLVATESKAEHLMAPMESEFEAADQITAGLGIYYFEEDQAV